MIEASIEPCNLGSRPDSERIRLTIDGRSWLLTRDEWHELATAGYQAWYQHSKQPHGRP